MVSALYKACSEGNLQAVQVLLNDINAANIEAQDESGSTALIEAVKLGNVEIVHILLDKGADPSHASPNGPPELFTTEQPILDLLAQAKSAQLSAATPYVHDGHDDSQKSFYPPPPEAYPYYPAMNPPISAEGAMFYPPLPPPSHPGMDGSHSPGGMNNLPPPEIARFIPCRYFPACRYGPSCIFAHPPQGYFPPGGPPPAQYPPFDPLAAPPYPPSYYPPPAFQQPHSPHPMVPLSPPPAPHMGHGRSPSEVVSPAQGPFSPNGMPIPVSYGPISPSGYPHPSQMSVSMPLPPIPPHHHQLPPPGPQSPHFIQDGMYPPAPLMPNANMNYSPEADGVPKPQLIEGYVGIPPMHRDGPGYGRRGGRRNSFNSRKPVCLFFPSGRCKNGDDCRFPHVMPDANAAPAHVPYYAGRGGGPRQPRSHVPPAVNGSTGLEEKLNQLNVADENSAQQSTATTQHPTVNSVEASKSSNTSDNGQGQANGNVTPSNGRPRFPQGSKHSHGYNHHHTNNNHHGKNQKQSLNVPSKQRVPGDDEFPVLGGAVTPPSRSPLNTNGPTAAQILQAPAPKKESATATPATHTREASPVRAQSPSSEVKDSSVNNSAPSEPPVKKLSISFAAVATAAGTSDTKEVSVSA